MIITLAVILLALLALINKKRGIKAFFSLFVNFVLIVIVIKIVSLGINPILIALLFSLTASAFILFFINGINSKTKISYLSIVFVLLMITLLIVYVGTRGHINGFGVNFNDIFYLYSTDLPINFIHVAIAVILMSLTGAITDTALDIASSLHEVHKNNSKASFWDLVKSGQNMSADILGTMVNTLFFVFMGEFMGFFILYHHYNYGFAVMVNDRLFLQEISQLLIGCLGCILIIPTIIFVQSYLYTKKNPRSFLMSNKSNQQ